MDEILKKYGLKYEDLNEDEKATLNSWVNNLQEGALSVDKIKEYIKAMKDSVENELSRYDLGPKQDIYLKARLRNYLLLELYLTAPEKAKAHIDRTLKGIKK